MSTESALLYLASTSPRRRELLEQIGVAVQVVRCVVEEQALPGESAAVYVQRVTLDKIRAGVAQAPADAVVLAADTIVVLNDQVLGKPDDREDALAMLRALSGQEHEVMTAVAVARGADVRSQRVTTRVRFRPLSEAEIIAYWDSGEPADKAGGYGIQGLGAVFVEHLAGSYSAVVGLPLMETAGLLAGFGIRCWQPR